MRFLLGFENFLQIYFLHFPLSLEWKKNFDGFVYWLLCIVATWDIWWSGRGFSPALFALALEGQVHTHQLPWIPSLWPLNPGGLHHILSPFHPCSCFSHQFKENKIICLVISKHFTLSQFCSSPGPVCCMEPQFWKCQRLRKGIQLFFSKTHA